MKELEKQEFYCQKCNYKFYSKYGKCPYCGQSDFLVEGEITLQRLL